MRPNPALLTALLLAALPAAAAPVPQGIEAWGFDLVLGIPVGAVEMSPGCGGGGFTQDAESGWFEYVEVVAPDNSGLPQPVPPGYFDTGCGTATFRVPVADGTSHVHVRFDADRRVTVLEPNPDSLHFIQEVRVFTDRGAQLAAVAYFAPDAGGQPMTAFDLPPVIIPSGTAAIEVVWYFEDTGYGTSQDLPNVLSGQDYKSRVQNATLEFSDARVEGARLEESARRSGTFRREELEVVAPVGAAALGNYTVDLRVRSVGGLEFARVEAPDGARLDDTVTRTAPGRGGFDRRHILVEHPETGTQQVTVPDAVLRQHGPGEYRVVFQRVSDIRAEPFLVPLALAMLALPIPFGVAAMRRIRSFEREAFGGFRRAARRLFFALVVVVLYYLVVVASAFVGGRLDLMASVPLVSEAILLYVQVVAAILAFLGLFLVARELDLITRPKAHAEAGDGR